MPIIIFIFMLVACETQTPEPEPAKELSAMDAPPDVAAPPSDATTTASGLAYKVIKKGSGTKNPEATSEVEVHYTGWQTDGTIFGCFYFINILSSSPA